ncbi:hypothetical protein [Brunnivagina elsteri]|uniref:Uncharacterized protein n=1 Tax=Brunnivagina elsteri CCALA 953 TaxID=987040 RepID=A0A2A2TQD1_9CYAN|nr:hypothetical protein [Calothrix elsteri]PAX60348.1 hypothetical protein CK510_02225 [Calothrix elsteri CCALA 953]
MRPFPKSIRLFIALFLLLILGFSGYRIVQYIFRPRFVSNIVNIETDSNKKTTYNLNAFISLPNSPYLIASINIGEDYRQGYYEKGADSTRNFLFFNVNDKSMRYLIPNNNLLFISHNTLGKPTESGVNELNNSTYLGKTPPNLNSLKEVKALWYEVVKNDTNNDKRLSGVDKKSIAMSDVSGANYTEVIDNINSVISTYQRDEKVWFVFWSSNNKNYASEIDILAKRVIKTQELPLIK